MSLTNWIDFAYGAAWIAARGGKSGIIPRKGGGVFQPVAFPRPGEGDERGCVAWVEADGSRHPPPDFGQPGGLRVVVVAPTRFEARTQKSQILDPVLYIPDALGPRP